MAMAYDKVAAPLSGRGSARVDDSRRAVAADDAELRLGVFGIKQTLGQQPLFLLDVARLYAHVVVDLAKDFGPLCADVSAAMNHREWP